MAQNKEENRSCAFRTSIGGQALIEGILMRGPEKEAIVVRNQEGELVEKVEPLKFVRDRYPILGSPLNVSSGWKSTSPAKSWRAPS